MSDVFAYADSYRSDSAATAMSQRSERRPVIQSTAFSSARTDWQEQAERRLGHVIRLPVGWDGYEGRPVNPTIAEYAFRLLEGLMTRTGTPLPSITPLSYGGLILEWHRKGWDIEIELDAPASHLVYAHELETGKEEEVRLGPRLETLKEMIGRISD